MVATISAREIAEAYTAFITEIFMTPEGCSRPDVDTELIRLEDSGELVQARKDTHIDSLIDEILRGTPEARRQLFLQTDTRLLALVYDRVLCGSNTLIKAAQKGIKIPSADVPILTDFFRSLLLQRLKP
ncbi:MAG: hypothetical protein GYA56_06425 [Geobacteraceae bacterium]|nr:hypothetical protein [Geobacteraceae bacterium]